MKKKKWYDRTYDWWFSKVFKNRIIIAMVLTSYIYSIDYLISRYSSSYVVTRNNFISLLKTNQPHILKITFFTIAIGCTLWGLLLLVIMFLRWLTKCLEALAKSLKERG